MRRLYRLASLRQPRGSMVVAAALDIWRGLVIESKCCAPVPLLQDCKDQSNPQPPSTPCTPSSASPKVAECGDRPAAPGSILPTGSTTAGSLVCRKPGSRSYRDQITVIMTARAPQNAAVISILAVMTQLNPCCTHITVTLTNSNYPRFLHFGCRLHAAKAPAGDISLITNF